MDAGKHTLISKVIESIRLEQSNTEVLMSQIDSGVEFNLKKKRLKKIH